MFEAVPGHRIRRDIRLILAILGLLALAGPADASGCHAPERPTFGIDDQPSPLDTSELTSPTPDHYRQAPCPGESIGFPSKIQIARSSLSTRLLQDPILAVEPRPIEPADLRPPLAESRPPERPPRGLPSA